MKAQYRILPILLFWITFYPAYSQKVVSYQQSGNNKSIVAGTSTLHDWTMTSTEATYDVKFEVSADGTPVQLTQLTYSVPAETLKSGKNAMDKNAYSSLHTDKHKKITFVMTSASIVDTKVKCTGNLTIAGVTKTIPVEATCKSVANGEITCNAKTSLKMTDYKVEPPTFMLGSIKTGNEIQLTFNITLSPIKL
jgi:polyisoprenoid-binding protein YceI